ncbi:MAG: serine hydrolase domain-containing protein [Bacteroidia bacterium]
MLALTIVGCNSTSIESQNGPVCNADTVQPRPDVSQLVLDFDSIMRVRLDSSRCPGAAVVIVQDSKIVFLKTYGVKSTADQSPLDAHTRFRIASMSKGFAGVVAAMLVAQGKLSLNERVIDILPDFQLSDSAQTARIRVWHLLSHCTGLPRHTYTGKVEYNEPRDSILAALRTVPLEGKEGEIFAYQNFSFSLIEDIVKIRTGKSYAQLLKEYIFLPAGMADAILTEDEWRTQPNKAIPHSTDRTGAYFPQDLNDKYFNTPSAGGVVASISDMAQWLKLLLGQMPAIAPKQVLDTAFLPRVETQSRAFAHRWENSLGSQYALGWRIIDMCDHHIICHGGTVNHYRSEIALDRNAGIGICFLWNAHCQYQATLGPEFFSLYEELSTL